MRVLAMSAVILLSLRICSGGERDESRSSPRAKPSADLEAKAEASAKAEVATRLVPRIGGNIVIVGDYALELLLFHDGRVRAHATTLEGMHALDPGRDRVAVAVGGEVGAKKKVELGWLKPRACFAGQVGAQIEPGAAVAVELEIDGTVAKAEFEGLALAYEPVIGGSVLVAGKHGVELVVGTDGEVEAVLRDRRGAELGAEAKANLEVELSGQGARPLAKLAWDGSRAAFVGRVRDGVKVAPGVVRVKLGLDGKTAIGGLSKLALTAKAAHGGRMLVAGDFSVELVAGANGGLQAFVFDTRGRAYTRGDLDLSLAIDGGPTVKLEWDARSLAYRAKLDAGLDLSAKPLRLSLQACCGRSYQGAVAGLSADARVRAKASAKLDAQASAQAAAGAKAGAGAKAKASLDVPKPKVDLKAKSPSVSAKASTSKSGGAKVGGKAGISFGTKK